MIYFVRFEILSLLEYSEAATFSTWFNRKLFPMLYSWGLQRFWMLFHNEGWELTELFLILSNFQEATASSMEDTVTEVQCPVGSMACTVAHVCHGHRLISCNQACITLLPVTLCHCVYCPCLHPVFHMCSVSCGAPPISTFHLSFSSDKISKLLQKWCISFNA
jgi:hypothetical protein